MPSKLRFLTIFELLFEEADVGTIRLGQRATGRLEVLVFRGAGAG